MTTEKNNSRNKIICIGLFVVFAVLTLICASRHELWFDEAQAWTIARDNTIGGIFEQLRYEGHPPLWYLILYVFSHLGFECSIAPIISWFFTAIAAAIVMFKAPFSIPIKALLIFSGGFLFFNSVMTRTYCLINLFLVLIAALFQKRKEHPIIFGILVALLANTHVCVSGFIGALGLIMLHDIYCDWKTNSAKKNVLNLAGLAIAGVGVLMLIIPLIGSLGSNNITSHNIITLKSCLNSFGESFHNASMFLLGGYLYAPYLLASMLSVFFIAMLILMRHKTRPCFILILSCVFYIITTEIVWFSNPNRVHVLLLIFFVVMWIAEIEAENKASEIWKKLNLDKTSNLMQKIIGAVKKLDINFSGTYKIILSAIIALSIPVGVTYFVRDCSQPFSTGKEISDYVKANLPEDSVFVMNNSMQTQISAYLPGYKFYSIEDEKFVTYVTHNKADEISYDKVYNDLKDYPNLYIINVNLDINAIESNRNIVYVNRGGIVFGTNALYVEISTLDSEEELKP